MNRKLALILVVLLLISTMLLAACQPAAEPTEEMEEVQRAQFEAFQEMGVPLLVMLIGFGLVTSVLQLVSGIGYLQQKKILGRMVGNAYAVVSIVSSAISGFMFGAEVGGGFNILTMVNLIYPVVTLILLNTTFRDDFTN